MMGDIAAEFRRKMAGLCRRMTPWERAAALRALQDERDAAVRALRERRTRERYAERKLCQSGPSGPRPS
jgi:hypothetical protein